MNDLAQPGSVGSVEARPAPFVSLVIPVLDEQEVLPSLLERLGQVGRALSGGWEVLFVDDGSHDDSVTLLTEAHRREPRIKLLQLSRNFGQAAAITAGLDHAAGDMVVLMDADLQDPPELVPQMVQLYREGFDVVHARRSTRRRETVFKRVTAALFYRFMRFATRVPIKPDVGEFRLISREVADALGTLRERHRLIRGLVSWLGFRQTTLSFERPGRVAGATKFGVAKMLGLSLDALTSFSAAPLRLATALGLLAILTAWATPPSPFGWATSSATACPAGPRS